MTHKSIGAGISIMQLHHVKEGIEINPSAKLSLQYIQRSDMIIILSIYHTYLILHILLIYQYMYMNLNIFANFDID